jgi:malonyl-CoA O-methyltransferase
MRWPWRRRIPELPPREAYDLWSSHYGDPPNALQQIEQEHLLAMMPPVEGQRVLDLGCGRGRVLAQLAELKPEGLLGLDLSLGMLARWVAPGVPRVAADLGRLPLRGVRFDLVVMNLVLAHLPSIDEALLPVLDLIRPGGRLLISDFHPDAATKGWQRTFRPPKGGRERAVRHYRHRLEDYRRPLSERGWNLEEVREPRWKDTPVLLLMRWQLPVGQASERRS